MGIIISMTYACITPESAENGDYSDHGFEFESENYTFKELINLIQRKGFFYCSSSNVTTKNITESEWISTEFETVDYSTGEKKSYSLHYDKDNNPQNFKYWVKALKVCGLIKD